MLLPIDFWERSLSSPVVSPHQVNLNPYGIPQEFQAISDRINGAVRAVFPLDGNFFDTITERFRQSKNFQIEAKPS